MASVDVGSALQTAIQAAVQPKLMENGWVVEENDTTLSEYVTMMIVNGKDLQGVQSELGGDLLGVGADDPAVGEFTQWLFETVNQLSAPQQQQSEAAQQDQPQPIPSVQDSQMEDTPASTDAPPTGPRSMRNGSGQGRGRGGRMLGQMNRQMDRSTDLPDNLRRIKGAAGGQSGRINAHANRDGPPRGPKSGIQRMMNGGGRGGNQSNMNPMGQMMMGGQMTPQAQMQFMEMMQMSAQMMAQAIQQNGGQANNGFQRGGARGGRGARGNLRGNRSQQASKELHAVDGKLPDVALSDNKGSSMDIDGADGQNDKFSTVCRFNLSCTNPACGFAHQSPAAPPNSSVDLADTCSFGVACMNHKCTARHPSPAQRQQHSLEVECKFFPNCTNPNCHFKHPSMPPCRNGADCTVPHCKFSHSSIACRYNPCTKSDCPFKHADGQKRGKFEDKVWTPNGEGGKAERFADFTKQGEAQEELIIPGQQNGQNGHQEETQTSQMETQIVV